MYVSCFPVYATHGWMDDANENDADAAADADVDDEDGVDFKL